MTKTLSERFPRPKDEVLPDDVQAAMNAMNRATKKMVERKRALGHKLVVWENGKVCIINP